MTKKLLSNLLCNCNSNTFHCLRTLSSMAAHNIFCSALPANSVRSCMFGFPTSALHPNAFVPNSPSSFTTCFYQRASQSTTKQGEGSGSSPSGPDINGNIVREALRYLHPLVQYTNNHFHMQRKGSRH